MSHIHSSKRQIYISIRNPTSSCWTYTLRGVGVVGTGECGSYDPSSDTGFRESGKERHTDGTSRVSIVDLQHDTIGRSDEEKTTQQNQAPVQPVDDLLLARAR